MVHQFHSQQYSFYFSQTLICLPVSLPSEFHAEFLNYPAMQLNENNQPILYEILFFQNNLVIKIQKSPSLMILSEDTDSTETFHKVLSSGFI